MNKLKIHELANSFPMLSQPELEDLANDIKLIGLNHPIVTTVIDNVPYIIDGRNRLAACELAGVEPTYTEYTGNIEDYIYSENITRRHLTISQRAMAEALLKPLGSKGNQYKKSAASHVTSSNSSAKTLSRARAIIKAGHQDLIDQIKEGTLTIATAYEETKARNSFISRDLLAELQTNAPDLAELVNNGDDLNSTYAVYRERKYAEKANTLTMLNKLSDAQRFFLSMSEQTMQSSLRECIYSEFLEGQSPDDVFSGLRSVVKNINGILGEQSE